MIANSTPENPTVIPIGQIPKTGKNEQSTAITADGTSHSFLRRIQSTKRLPARCQMFTWLMIYVAWLNTSTSS